MLKRLRIVELCLVAVFAVAAVASASASAALPEYWHCVKSAAGTDEYPTKAACEKGEKKGEEPREWSRAAVVAGEKIAFTSTSGAGTLETKHGGNRITKCTADKDKGEITGPKEDKVVVEFTGCTSAGGLLKCKSAGAAAEEIKTNTLKSKLVYTNEAKKEVGVLLEPETAGGLNAEFTCEGSGVKEVLKVRGAVIGKITPVNKWVLPPETFTLTFTQSKGVQSPTEYEAGGVKVKPATLETEGTGTGLGSETWTYEQSGEATTDTITLAEAGEIKA